MGVVQGSIPCKSNFFLLSAVSLQIQLVSLFASCAKMCKDKLCNCNSTYLCTFANYLSFLARVSVVQDAELEAATAKR
jgi:hypothetical protein